MSKFDNVRLGPNEPFSKICTHCVLIGYSMTRRAMTAAFSPQDEPDVLCKIQWHFDGAEILGHRRW